MPRRAKEFGSSHGFKETFHRRPPQSYSKHKGFGPAMRGPGFASKTQNLWVIRRVSFMMNLTRWSLGDAFKTSGVCLKWYPQMLCFRYSPWHFWHQMLKGYHHVTCLEVVNIARLQYTPPKTNMEPANGLFEKEIPFGSHHFQVPC